MLALLGKDNDKGLGVITRELAEHLPVEKVFCVIDRRTTSRNPNFIYTDKPEDIPLEGIKTLIIMETPFQKLLERCKEAGIKTILQVNYEFLPEKLRVEPNLYWCSTSKNYEAVKSNKVLLPFPVDTSKIPFRLREKANVFVHNAGTLGMGGANGTQELLDAIPLVKSDVKFLIRSQLPIKISNRRVDLRIGSVPNYWEMWNEGDVFVQPHKFRAMSLPIQEAMASGMPVLTTNIKPFNEMCHFTFPFKEVRREMISRMVDYHTLDPKEIAKAIDDMAGKDISKESKEARAWATKNNWQSLTNKFIEICNL